MSTATKQKWLTTEQAANYLNMHIDTIKTLFRRGDIKATKPGRVWRATTDWLDDYMYQGVNGQ